MGYRALQVGVTARAAALLHGRPSKRLRVVLILGQDGAAGTAAYLAAMLEAAGEKVGVITSQFIQIAGGQVKGSDQADLISDANHMQGLLSQMAKAGCHYVIIELPPELPRHRFIGVTVHMLIVRRCGDNYVNQGLQAARLEKLSNLLAMHPKFVVYNRDDRLADALDNLHGQDGVISFGIHHRAEGKVTQVQLHPRGSQVDLTVDHHTRLTLTTSGAGKQGVYNMAGAAAAAYVLQIPVAAIEQGCRAAAPLPSHFQLLDILRPYRVILDSATSPEGLAETLDTAKQFCRNRLIVVFGAPLNAPLSSLAPIGELLAKSADRLFITDGEYQAHMSPKRLRHALWQGIGAAGESFAQELPDRTAAIEKAIAVARRGDVVLIAGSGVHPYRQLGTERVTWSDQETLKGLFGA